MSADTVIRCDSPHCGATSKATSTSAAREEARHAMPDTAWQWRTGVIDGPVRRDFCPNHNPERIS